MVARAFTDNQSAMLYALHSRKSPYELRKNFGARWVTTVRSLIVAGLVDLIDGETQPVFALTDAGRDAASVVHAASVEAQRQLAR